MGISGPPRIEIFEREQFYLDFPDLTKLNHRVTSHPTPDERYPKRPYYVYNCLGMAVGDTTKFWWPGGRGYWPRQSEDTIEEIVWLLSSEYGYVPCEDGSFQQGTRKIAIFADAQRVPQHVAFQPLHTGSQRRKWKSKMGYNVNIEHELWAVAGQCYGTPSVFMGKAVDE